MTKKPDTAHGAYANRFKILQRISDENSEENGVLTILSKQQRPHTYNNQGYLPNGAVGGHPTLPPGAAPLLPNNGRIIQQGGIRVLCVADVRGGCFSWNEKKIHGGLSAG